MGNLLENLEKYLLKEMTYYLICRSGAINSRTAKKLVKQGFSFINATRGMVSYSGPNRK